MKFKVTLPSGTIVECDAPEDVLALERLAATALHGAKTDAPVATPVVSRDEQWLRFMGLVEDKEPQLVVLRFLKKKGQEPTSLEELARVLKVDSTAVAGGTVSGIRKNSKKVFKDTDAVIKRLENGEYIAAAMLQERDLKVRRPWQERLVEDD